MKKLLVLLISATALLSACVAYDVPDRDRPVYRGDRDRDRDGIPNRVDRDRDGDGVPNWRDNRPGDARRY